MRHSVEASLNTLLWSSRAQGRQLPVTVRLVRRARWLCSNVLLDLYRAPVNPGS